MKRTPLKKGNKTLRSLGKGLSSKGLKRGSNRLKSRKKDPIKIQQERELKELMWRMFLEIWEERGPYSEISGQYIPGEPLSIYFHHCLPKAQFPWTTLLKESIIVLTFEEHQRAEQNPNFYNKIVEIRNKVVDLYNK